MEERKNHEIKNCCSNVDGVCVAFKFKDTDIIEAMHMHNIETTHFLLPCKSIPEKECKVKLIVGKEN